MQRIPSRFALFVLTLATAPLLAAEPKDDFFFHKGDRVVFLGDSITEQYQYSSFIELFLTTRFPDGNMTFLNAGISGDTAGGGAHRFARHVLAERPTCVTIDFGMNDGGYGEFDPNLAASYIKNTRAMLEAAKKANVRVALVSPNAVEVRSKPDLKIYLETQQKFYSPLKDLAAQFHVPFVDQYAITRKALEKIAADNAPLHPFPDGVHTNGAGGLLMAHTILVGLDAPAVVSDLEIDTAQKNSKAKGCTIDALMVASDQVSFRRKDQALPLPVPNDCRPLLPYVKHLKDLNYYGLKVSGLAPGKYVLAIDGIAVATFEKDDLVKGVNLGNLEKGPLFDQGMKVLRALNAKNDSVVHPRIRDVVMFEAAEWLSDLKRLIEERQANELRKRMQKLNDLQAEVYKLAQPVAHRFVLKQEKK
jgi:lysophospholipase L1-like esterase